MSPIWPEMVLHALTADISRQFLSTSCRLSIPWLIERIRAGLVVRADVDDSLGERVADVGESLGQPMGTERDIAMGTGNTKANKNALGAEKGSLHTRRTIVKSAAWGVPVIAAAAAAPIAAASPTYAIESSFGVGWYPNTPGNTTSGGLQYDAVLSNTYYRITGVKAGDVISNVYFEVLISASWPAPTFTALSGSNPSWSVLSQTGTTVVNGVSYNVYRSTYSGTVTATGSVVDIPVGFAFRSLSPYYAGALAQTSRFATVNSTPVTLVRNPANINNTNEALSTAPRP